MSANLRLSTNARKYKENFERRILMSQSQAIAFHLRFGDRRLLPELKRFISQEFVAQGVSHLILEIDKSFVFTRHPELKTGSHALTKEDARELSELARHCQIEIVPLIQCLGHQGWGGSRSALLTAYPEFDETPETPLTAEWPDIFCRSWCPLHPDVNAIVYDLLDEVIEAFDAKAIHIGMDEVYEIASNQCPRCRGKKRANLFAKAVKDMHAHIVKAHQLDLMMWGDRLIDAERFGYDNWEADTFGTYHAIDLIPKDIIILDWHYDERPQGYPTPAYFMQKGFRVMPACWYKENVADQLFEETTLAAKEQAMEDKYFGRLVTSWHHWDKEGFNRFEQISTSNLTDESELSRLYRSLQIASDTKYSV